MIFVRLKKKVIARLDKSWKSWHIDVKMGHYFAYIAAETAAPPSRASSLGISIFFFPKILRNQRKMDRPPSLLRLFTLFLMQPDTWAKWKKTEKKRKIVKDFGVIFIKIHHEPL